MIALSVAETNHGLSAVCNAVENRVDDIEYIDNNCVCRNRSVAAKTLKQTVEHHKDCRKDNSLINGASPSEHIPPYVRKESFVFLQWNVFFLRMTCKERIRMLTIGEKPVASAAPSISKLHGNTRT